MKCSFDHVIQNTVFLFHLFSASITEGLSTKKTDKKQNKTKGQLKKELSNTNSYFVILVSDCHSFS